MNRLLSSLLLAGLLAAASNAQEAAKSGPRSSVDAGELFVTPYTPTEFSADHLFKAANQLFGEQIVVTEPARSGGASAGFSTVPRFVVLGQLLLIRDTKEQGAAIVATLKALEQSEVKRRKDEEDRRAAERARIDLGADPDESAEYTATASTEFRPRYVEFNTLFSALKPFERQVRFARDGGSEWTTRNLNAIPDGNVIVVCETPRRLKDLQALVARIDRPQPQMMVTVTLLRVASAPDEVEKLAKELDQNLKALLPAPGFKSLGVGALRCAMQSGRQCMLRTELPDGGVWSLKFFPDAYNPDTQEFSLSNCEFSLTTAGGTPRPSSTQSFLTSLTFRAGEYVVLGGVGESPTLVVLRAQAVAQPH